MVVRVNLHKRSMVSIPNIVHILTYVFLLYHVVKVLIMELA